MSNEVLPLSNYSAFPSSLARFVMPSREEIHKAYREGEEAVVLTRDVDPPRVWLTVPRRVYRGSRRIAMREGIPARVTWVRRRWRRI